jgi:hypothetical protein
MLLSNSKSRRSNTRSLRNGSQNARGDPSGSPAPISQVSVFAGACNARFLRFVECQIPLHEGASRRVNDVCGPHFRQAIDRCIASRSPVLVHGARGIYADLRSSHSLRKHLSISLSLKRWILPVAVLGNTGRRETPKSLKKMAGTTEVPLFNETNGLAQGEGEISSLRCKGYFEGPPHPVSLRPTTQIRHSGEPGWPQGQFPHRSGCARWACTRAAISLKKDLPRLKCFGGIGPDARGA